MHLNRHRIILPKFVWGSHDVRSPMVCGVPCCVWSHGVRGPIVYGVPWCVGSHGVQGPIVCGVP